MEDDAAIFAIAMSLYEGIVSRADDGGMPISDDYDGMDNFMRQCMRVARLFEAWACRHVNFDEMDVVWPYYLEEKFCAAFLRTYAVNELGEIVLDDHCLVIANNLNLPLLDFPRGVEPPPSLPAAPPAGTVPW
jgi:hypothetical protein